MTKEFDRVWYPRLIDELTEWIKHSMRLRNQELSEQQIQKLKEILPLEFDRFEERIEVALKEVRGK